MCKPGPNNNGAPSSLRATLVRVLRTFSEMMITASLGLLCYGVYFVKAYDEGMYLATGIVCLVFSIACRTASGAMPYQGNFNLNTFSYVFMLITAIATIVLVVMTSICINWWVKWVNNVDNRPDGWEWWDYFFILATVALMLFELILFLVSVIVIAAVCCVKYKAKKKKADASTRSGATRPLTAAVSAGEALNVAQMIEVVPGAEPSHITVSVVANDGEPVNVTNNPVRQ